MLDVPTARDRLLSVFVRVLFCVLLGGLTFNAARYLDFRHPFIGYGFGGVFLLHMRMERSAWRFATLGVLASALVTCVMAGRYEGFATLVAQFAGALGLASLLFLTCAVFWNGRTQEANAFRALVPAIALLAMLLAAQSMLNTLSWFHSKTLDLYAFAFDGSLGFQPSFVLARFVNSVPWLLPLAKISYEGMPLVVAGFYAGFMLRRQGPLWEIITLLAISTVTGYVFFCIFPVCGPGYAFGPEFPGKEFSYASLQGWTRAKMSLPRFDPRNGVPSLHLTWALLIWINTRSLSPWARSAVGVFLLVTVFDTLASGEHYLFDLIAALPFTLWMQASMTLTVSFWDRRRWKPAICGFGLFFAWLVIGRFGIDLMMASRATAWLFVLASSTLSITWAMRLPPMIPEMQKSLE